MSEKETVGAEEGKHRDKLTVTTENTNRCMKILLRQVDGLEKARKGFISVGDMENATKFNIAINSVVDKLNALVIVPTDMETSAEAKKEKADFDLMSIVIPDSEPETEDAEAEPETEDAEAEPETTKPKPKAKPKK